LANHEDVIVLPVSFEAEFWTESLLIVQEKENSWMRLD